MNNIQYEITTGIIDHNYRAVHFHLRKICFEYLFQVSKLRKKSAINNRYTSITSILDCCFADSFEDKRQFGHEYLIDV